ncbi:hypothetical protein ACF0H5_013426 [Mactra antiquata]
MKFRVPTCKAVYGGRMSGRRQKDLKVNPVYNDVNHFAEMTGNMDALRVVTYETFPREKLTVNGKHLQNGDVRNNKNVNETNEKNNEHEPDRKEDDKNIMAGHESVELEREIEQKQGTVEQNIDEEIVYAQPVGKKVGKAEHLRAEVSNERKENRTEFHNEINKRVVDTGEDGVDIGKKVNADKYGLLRYNNNINELDNIYVEIDDKVNDSKDETNIEEEKNESNASVQGDNIFSEDGNDEESLAESGCDSPVSSHVGITTEALVHSSDVQELGTCMFSAKTPVDMKCNSLESDSHPSIMSKNSNDISDWPDLDSLVRKSEDENQNCDLKPESIDISVDNHRHIRSISDVVGVNVDSEVIHNEMDSKKDVENARGSRKNKKSQKTMKSNARSVSATEASSTRTLKSILTSSTGVSGCSCDSETERKSRRTDSEIQECKSVKFSKDTVFNENKSGKYKKEKFKHINLRDIYRGKISSDSAIAKMNPLFQTDEDTEGVDPNETNGSLSSSEKLAYQLTLKNALRLSKEKPTGINGPSYLEQYLILKAHGLTKENFDIEKLPETIETPAYDRLIQRTLAKERRKICVKWSFVIIIVAVITAVATTVGVYFKQGF